MSTPLWHLIISSPALSFVPPDPSEIKPDDEAGVDDPSLELPFDDDPTGAVDDEDLDAFGDHELGSFEDDGFDSLDDVNASELDMGDLVANLDEMEGALDDDAPLDVGALDDGLVLDDDSASDDETSGLTDEDMDLSLLERAELDDGGAEGTNESPEVEVDESALPALDDDDDDLASEGEALAEDLLAASEEMLPAWDPARWTVVEGAGASVPCRSVWVDDGRVLAAGEVLLIVDEGAKAAHQAAFGSSASAVAATDNLVLVGSERGQLLLGRDGEGDTISLSSSRAGRSHVDLVATPGRLWVRSEGALLCLSDPSKALLPVRERGVLAMAASGGAVVTVSSSAVGPVLERLRSDDEGWQSHLLRGTARRLVERAGTLMLAASAGGRVVALSDGSEIDISRDGGAGFASVAFGPVRAMVFAGDDAEAPLCVLVSAGPESEGTLVQVPPSGEATRIAELPALGASSVAMAWDSSREVLWVASGAGLVSLGRARRH